MLTTTPMNRLQALNIICAEAQRVNKMPGRPGPYARACAVLGLTEEQAFDSAKGNGLLGWTDDEATCATFRNCYHQEAKRLAAGRLPVLREMRGTLDGSLTNPDEAERDAARALDRVLVTFQALGGR